MGTPLKFEFDFDEVFEGIKQGVIREALIEAEKNKEASSIQAEQARIKAQGEADAKKIAAEAEAEANRKIAESLTPELIEKIKYEQWNGELPQVQGSGTSIVDITK